VAAQFPGFSLIMDAAHQATKTGYHQVGSIAARAQGDTIRVHARSGKMRAWTEFSLVGGQLQLKEMSVTGTGSLGRTYAMNIKPGLPRVRLRIIDRARKTREYPLATAAPRGGVFHQLEQALGAERGTPRRVARKLSRAAGALQGEALAETLPGYSNLKAVASGLAQKQITGATMRSGRASGVALGTFESLTKGPVQTVSTMSRQGDLTVLGTFDVVGGEARLKVATVAGLDKSGRKIALKVRPGQKAQLIAKGLNNQWRAHTIGKAPFAVRIEAPTHPSGWQRGPVRPWRGR